MTLLSVILSGGAVTRLWPVSRQTYPKPFLNLGGSTLLEQAITRGQACGADELLLVTNHEHYHLSRSLLAQMSGAPSVHYMLEPKGRNTAPAIALAALDCAARHGGQTPMLVLPADHLIPDTETFVLCVMEALQLARLGQIVVFGIQPTQPDTGFGYIEVAQTGRNSQKVLRFVEKPDLATAQQYLATGRHYWNSGMFCFSAQTILDALELHAPTVLSAARAALHSSQTTVAGIENPAGIATRFDAHHFNQQPDISIDYAVMERADNVTVVPARFGWSDVGSWPAVAQAHAADASGNSFMTDVVDIDTTGTHVQVESHGPKIIATVGVRDLIIVDTPDALLVAHKGSAQKVKAVVEILKERHHPTTHLPTMVHRPWGTYATLKAEQGPNGGYKVKRITVKPGQRLSLQYHHHRAEHWVVVQGHGCVQLGDTEHQALPGQYHYIPAAQKHRLTNVGKDDLVLVEVQCGSYLEEDDIVRLADSYGRV